ncbi:MAG: hypothetical protein RLY16_1433 [Bacteroidota bacterium]|jgi:outer membrane protein OmpA-like peptidoglycan-associated protein
MKQRLFIVAGLLLLATMVNAQKAKKYSFIPGAKKPTLFGVAFTLSDFNAPKSFGANGNATALAIRDMSAGVSVSYWKGLTPFIDFSAKLNGVFHDYSALYNNLPGKTEIGLEFEPSVNFRPLKDENLWAPFLTTGAGLGLYTNRVGAYVPLGAGIQFNGNRTTYLFLQAQYKVSLTPSVLPDNMFYSFGFAQNVSSDDEPAVAPKPALPVVVAPKDTDGDGVADDADECPTAKGTAAFKGCPDTDGDGIADKSDKCPDVKGLLKYGGCPVPDRDKDGINDEEDKCPDAAGFARYGGCPVPDTDADGINDEEDKCPKVAGVAANFGCPAIEEAVVAKVKKAAQNLFFATGSARLLASSNVSLNNVVALLQQNPDYKVDISGYTDNTGDATRNRNLSEERAISVKNYLVKKGISESRITAQGFGDENPLGDNNTAAGRAKNRRVEMTLRNY